MEAGGLESGLWAQLNSAAGGGRVGIVGVLVGTDEDEVFRLEEKS